MRFCYAQCAPKRVAMAAMAVVFTAAGAFAQVKMPVPDAASQAKAQELVRDVYGQEYDTTKTSPQRLDLAKSMLKEASKTKTDPAGHFVLLRIAKDVAALAGDAETALVAAGKLIQAFDVDPLQTRVECLEAVARGAKLPSQHGPLAKQAYSLVGTAVAEDKYEAARKLGEIAQDSARKARDYALAKKIGDLMKIVAECQEKYAEHKKAITHLHDNPTDPDSNLSAGRYLCLVKSNWGKGIPMLALGSDAELKAVSIMELKDTDSPETQVALADAWWKIAQKTADVEKEALTLRARYWYQQAQANLRSGLVKMRVDNRLEEIDKTESSTRTLNARVNGRAERIQFLTSEPLKQFVLPIVPEDAWTHADRSLILRAPKGEIVSATFRTYYRSIDSVTIRGGIPLPIPQSLLWSPGSVLRPMSNCDIYWAGNGGNRWFSVPT